MHDLALSCMRFIRNGDGFVYHVLNMRLFNRALASIHLFRFQITSTQASIKRKWNQIRI